MQLFIPRRFRWVTILAAAATSKLAAANDAVDEAMLTDILQSYTGYDESTCPTGAVANTTTSFDWPGVNLKSGWASSTVKDGYEQMNFQAIMKHTAPDGDARSWEIRISTGGNIYSYYTPDMELGEVMPPQHHPDPKAAPWIDEVQQSISVNNWLNGQVAGKQYFVHQAGAYQTDTGYAGPSNNPFFSPSLAKHCSGNSCMFASWGTQAHIPTPFISTIMFINKYTNCGNGILEHSQMIHNFANPNDEYVIANPEDITHNYFNIGWGGVRTTTLPHALEPDPVLGTFEYDITATQVDVIQIRKWGNDHDAGASWNSGTVDWRGERKSTAHLGGYTTFVNASLVVTGDDHTSPPWQAWCRTGPSCANPGTCMVSSCTDDEVANESFTRVQLKVEARQSPACQASSLHSSGGQDLILVRCKMRDSGFGQTEMSRSSYDPNSLGTKIGFNNTITSEILPIPHFKHYSWSVNDQWVYFAVEETVGTDAVNLVNAWADNTGRDTVLLIEVVEILADSPLDYNPGTFDTFTFVYGDDSGASPGRQRRRIGSSSRDYTVFTINWLSGASLAASESFVKKGFYFVSDLARVKETADDLRLKTHSAKITGENWTPRIIDVYYKSVSGDPHIAVVAAADSVITSTNCNTESTLVTTCRGFSTTKNAHVPFFYVTCGIETYFGPNPYHFILNFGSSFPPRGPNFYTDGTGHSTDSLVRSYSCNGSTSMRPTWKMMGFFDPTVCTSLTEATYDESTFSCPSGTSSPSTSQGPSDGPSEKPSTQPSVAPSDKPSTNPSDAPSVKPSLSPSDKPSGLPSGTPSVGPTKQASASPSDEPSVFPTDKPSDVPSTSPSDKPSTRPTQSPSLKPSIQPSQAPSNSPSAQPSLYPSLKPSIQPSQAPSLKPSSQPSSPPSGQPSDMPSSTARPSQASRSPSVSASPSSLPSESPSVSGPPSHEPTPKLSEVPSQVPTSQPSNLPSETQKPSTIPSANPSIYPTGTPSNSPTETPVILILYTATITINNVIKDTFNGTSFGKYFLATLRPYLCPDSTFLECVLTSDCRGCDDDNSASIIASTELNAQFWCKPGSNVSECVLNATDAGVKGQSSLQNANNDATFLENLAIQEIASSQSSVDSRRLTGGSFEAAGVELALSPVESIVPSKEPSSSPTQRPSTYPSDLPSGKPSNVPSSSSQPSESPSASAQPSSRSESPSVTSLPTGNPSLSASPSSQPSVTLSTAPSLSSQPSSIPSEEPSGLPSSQPSGQPSSVPSEDPSSLPSLSPSVQPSSIPSEKPSSRPSSRPSESPSSLPSQVPSGQPSFLPSEHPSPLPSQVPSGQPSPGPSENPSLHPSAGPTMHPSGKPSASSSPTVSSAPSTTIGQIITIGNFMINADVCNLIENDYDIFVKAVVNVLQDAADCGHGSLPCIAQVMKICDQWLNNYRPVPSSRSLQWTSGGQFGGSTPSSRRLQGTSEIQFKIITNVVCSVAACTSDEDTANTRRMSEVIMERVNNAIHGGSLTSALESALAIEGFVLNCLVAWGGISSASSNSDFLSDVGDAIPTTATFYPDWDGNSGTCINDDNAPRYQKLNPSEWIYDNLEACCDRYYSGYEKAKCMNKQGSGLWAVDWINGRCSLDCEVRRGRLCGGVVGGTELFLDPMSCCQSKLPWVSSEFCQADSLDVDCYDYDGTKKYYSSSKTCVKDCKTADSNCGGIIHEPHVSLYDSLETCCAAEFGWITRGLCVSRSNSTVTEKYWPDKVNSKCVKDSETAAKDLSVQLFVTAEECCDTSITWERSVACIATSTGEIAQGTSNYFVDWTSRKCVQDCEGGAPCGGIAKKWDILYTSARKCCGSLWNDPDKCDTQ